MSNLPGNPHVHEGPQVATSETINDHFIAEEGVTAETVILSELTRNTEATYALAHEQRTIALQAERTYALNQGDTDRLYELTEQISTRLGGTK
ncbi:hypothetical protein DQ353_00320 [Arthrobacter sp. AQ5-05]|uniref:hypothetical protein n=1 Tax=Arthrobacter sp. AQ5-05 TaxID=2184581 RepID=UPI000DCC8828|nr:hypothetical protein [Arthrobacter sp. AQ5-05]RAX50882.1 hypothetical protein DQ353_00320 [Arthrobacter sp. AQ5-05]